NALIAVAWQDLKPNASATETIQHFVTGTAPFRKFVVDYIDVPQDGTGGNITVQLQIHETTNVIEIHSVNVSFTDRQATQGIESHGMPTGTLFYSAGRNDVMYSATSDYVAFVPQCLDEKLITVNPLPSTGLTIAPAATKICSGDQVAITIESTQTG